MWHSPCSMHMPTTSWKVNNKPLKIVLAINMIRKKSMGERIMNPTTRIYFWTSVFALVLAFIVVAWATKPVMAQTREIPVYVQIRLNNVIKDAAAAGDIIWIEKTNLNSVVALLDHRNQRVASAAAYALGEIRDPEAAPALIEALKSDRDHMRRIAAHALGKIGDRRAVMPLIEVLCDEAQPMAVQASAITSLGRIGDPRAKRILTQLNRSSRNWLRQTASVALLKINAKQNFRLAAAK